MLVIYLLVTKKTSEGRKIRKKEGETKKAFEKKKRKNNTM